MGTNSIISLGHLLSYLTKHFICMNRYVYSVDTSITVAIPWDHIVACLPLALLTFAQFFHKIVLDRNWCVVHHLRRT
jgi:hypothetical protein